MNLKTKFLLKKITSILCLVVAIALFCTGCGNKLTQEEKTVFCMNCGQKISASALFCNNCGAKVE